MNINKNTKLSLVVASLSLGLFSQAALAELYVSPVIRDTVTFDKQSNDLIKSSDSRVSGKSTLHGDFEIKSGSSSKEAQKEIMQYGKNVPLFVAIEKIIPNSSSWVIHYDDGVSNVPVSWDGGDHWSSVLELIEKNSGIYITINESERAIGASRNNVKSQYLAHKVSQVWELDTDLSLRDNVSAWAKEAGWTISWQEGLNIDFPILNKAVLHGPFEGKDGVLDKLLRSVSNYKQPLVADFYEMNSVALIKESGYKQGVINK